MLGTFCIKYHVNSLIIDEPGKVIQNVKWSSLKYFIYLC